MAITYNTNNLVKEAIALKAQRVVVIKGQLVAFFTVRGTIESKKFPRATIAIVDKLLSDVFSQSGEHIQSNRQARRIRTLDSESVLCIGLPDMKQFNLYPPGGKQLFDLDYKKFFPNKPPFEGVTGDGSAPDNSYDEENLYVRMPDSLSEPDNEDDIENDVPSDMFVVNRDSTGIRGEPAEVATAPPPPPQQGTGIYPAPPETGGQSVPPPQQQGTGIYPAPPETGGQPVPPPQQQGTGIYPAPPETGGQPVPPPQQGTGIYPAPASDVAIQPPPQQAVPPAPQPIPPPVPQAFPQQQAMPAPQMPPPVQGMPPPSLVEQPPPFSVQPPPEQALHSVPPPQQVPEPTQPDPLAGEHTDVMSISPPSSPNNKLADDDPESFSSPSITELTSSVEVVTDDEIFAKSPDTLISKGSNPIDTLLKMMIDRQASDLHLSCDRRIVFRIDGEMEIDDELPAVTVEKMKEWFTPIIPAKQADSLQRNFEIDFTYEIVDLGRFRMTLCRDLQGLGAVIHHVPNKIQTCDDLQLPEIIKKICYLSKGLVLVTGPAGCGKSTTLAAMIDQINSYRKCHVLTIEEPIEFVHVQKNSLVRQREVSRHTASFKSALQAALREDPDVIAVGELNDAESVALAIRNVENGRLVFANMHTRTSVASIERLINLFPADRHLLARQVLAEALRGVISQTLVRKKSGGRVAVFEVLIVNDAVVPMIKGGKMDVIHSYMETQRSAGNISLNDSLLSLFQNGIIDNKAAIIAAANKKSLKALSQVRGIKLI